MKIWAHCLVKNEERFIWYSVESIVNYVDKILLWDTGSTDDTKKIIKLLKRKYPSKINTNFLKSISVDEFTSVRQKMLEKTKSDWFLVVDGDEVWWKDSIEKLTNFIHQKGNNFESIVVPTINLMGDIYHFQKSSEGRYKLAGKTGHFALRAINQGIPGLSSSKPHGTWGWTDKGGQMIQDRNLSKIKFLNCPYMHFTFLKRSKNDENEKDVPKRVKKYKFEIGKEFEKDFYYPEVFFQEKPSIIPEPWERMKGKAYVKSLVQTPLKRFKRRVFTNKVGY